MSKDKEMIVSYADAKEWTRSILDNEDSMSDEELFASLGTAAKLSMTKNRAEVTHMVVNLKWVSVEE
jgi:hypothetical protein